MADSAVENLTAVATPAATDVIPVKQAGVGRIKNATVSQYIAVGATDNAIVRADGTSTVKLQGSSASIDDNGRVTTGTGTDGGVALGSGSRIADSNSDGRWDFINAGGSRMDLIDVGGGAWRLRVGSALQLGSNSSGGYYVGTSAEHFEFRGGNGTDWYAEGTGGAVHQIGWIQGGYSGVSRGPRFYRSVEANTAGSGAPNVIVENETRRLFTNEGTTAENYHTLPTAVAGLEFVFYCQDTDGIRIVANTADTIRIGASASATAGFVRSVTVGSVLHLFAINDVEWVGLATGTWLVDT